MSYLSWQVDFAGGPIPFHDVCVHAEATAKAHTDAPSIKKDGVWYDSCLEEASVMVVP